MSKKQQVKVLPPVEITEGTTEQQTEKRITSASVRRVLSTVLTDQLANSIFWVRNQPLPKAKEIFPMEWNLQHCELFYPHAEGGPLYVDFPKTEWQTTLCQRKLEAMKKIGVRYVYITAQTTENDARRMLEWRA